MKEFEEYRASLSKAGWERTEDALVADLGEKILQHWHGDELRSTYPISYSKLPRSCKQDSLGTPWGLHSIAGKFGDAQPAGMVFVGRKPTGKCWMELDEEDNTRRCHVVTRILRLRGLEQGVNAGEGIDSFDRYIYIHGTNHPDAFPENISAGCLLMRDADLIDLYEVIPASSHVWISLP